MNGIGIKTQSFGKIADPFRWNFILEKDMDHEEDKASQSLSTSLSSVSSSLPSSSTATTAITSSSSSSPPVPANKKRKLNKVTSNVDVSSNDDYPHLLHALGKEEYGFNPRLVIPAGILRIPVFSSPVALFSQESRFLFLRNFLGTPSGILSVPGLRT